MSTIQVRTKGTRSPIRLLPVFLIAAASSSFGWTASGTVKSVSGTALSGVSVSVQDSSYKATTDASGAFSIVSSSGVSLRAMSQGFSIRHSGNDLLVSLATEGTLELSLVDLSGSVIWSSLARLDQGVARFHAPTTRNVSHAIMRIRLGEEVLYRKTVLTGREGWRDAPSVLARALAAYPTLLFKKPGYQDASYAMKSATESGIAVTMSDTGETPWVEDHRDECKIPTFPAASTLKSIPTLPDPFTMFDGTKVTTKAQWKCRREEMLAQAEFYELGEKPRHPTSVTATMSGTTMTITVTDKGKSVKFTVKVTKPSGAGPFPAMITYDGSGVAGGLSGMPIAIIDYTCAKMMDASAPNQMAKDGSGLRGQGIFYDLYGKDHSAGANMAWAWGVSRIIDALAANPSFGIDAKRVGVTGCSRFGKGSLFAGVYDQRVALTVPQEGGSGGCSSWRAIAFQKSLGQDIEQLQNLAGGTNWFRQSFGTDFNNSTTAKIPFDHHQLAGAIAPRGFLDIESSGIAWLGGTATYVSNMGANEIYKALGATENHAYSLKNHGNHCQLQADQTHWVKSSAQKFLLGGAGEPAKLEQIGVTVTYDRAKWIDWTTPTLN